MQDKIPAITDTPALHASRTLLHSPAVKLDSLSLVLILCAVAIINAPAQAAAQSSTPDAERPKRLAEGIQDNSFLIEEAYNQEEGVVQHIMNVVYAVNRHAGPDDRELALVFTQEWPVFSQRHQLSYALPYSFMDSGGHRADGIRDILLNYRYQAILETDTHPAFAPRFSLILPPGNADEGFGNGRVAYQVNLPLSKIVGDRWTVHANAGVTVFPDVEGHNLVSPNIGASAIYAVTATFNLMLESIAFWNDQVNDSGGTDRPVSAVISPGFRYAINHSNDAQTVIGLAVPIGITSAAPDISVFVYLSYEHFFYRPRARGK